jgi:hypothetical protein
MITVLGEKLYSNTPVYTFTHAVFKSCYSYIVYTHVHVPLSCAHIMNVLKGKLKSLIRVFFNKHYPYETSVLQY